MSDWNELKAKIRESTAEILIKETKVEPGTTPIKPEDLYSTIPKWVEYKDVVAISADLKNSTAIFDSKLLYKSVAAIHDAAIGSAEKILRLYDAEFIDIQGDGVIGLFTGNRRIEKALVASISITTYSKKILEEVLTSKWGVEEAPKTGFKVGVSAGKVLAKNIGSDKDSKSPVWVGTPVNFAVKAGSEVDAHQIGLTSSISNIIKKNQYFSYTCGHAGDGGHGDIAEVLKPITFTNIPAEEATGSFIENQWCDICGNDFVKAILSGQTNRNI